MTVANQITVTRILLIPVFVLFGVGYGLGVRAGTPFEPARWVAFAAFVIAALCDALDGYVARRFHQGSRLGAILDPLADKGLLLATVLTLSLSGWPTPLPIWFAALVIGRDALIVGACVALHWIRGTLKIRPTPLGKASTFAQMLTAAWVMVELPGHRAAIAGAAALTALSGAGYALALARGWREEDHGERTGG